MALRTVLSLIAVGSITADKIDLADDFNFTGAVQKDGTDLITASSNLYYAVVDFATTANVNLSAASNSVDGVGVQNGMDALVWRQTTGSQNGVYNVDSAGSGSNGSWSRPGERDASGELPPGLLVYVKAGTLYGQMLFKLTGFAGTLGTDALTFEPHDEGYSVINNGEPLSLAGADGAELNFDITGISNVKYAVVLVNGIPQPGSVYSIVAGAGAGGVDQLQFASGNAPASGDTVEVSGLYLV